MSAPHVPAARRFLIEKYDAQGKAYEFSTVQLYSTQELPFAVVDHDATNGVAYAVLRENTILKFFGYGLSGDLSVGGDKVSAKICDTNLQKPTETNGAQDVSVEAMSLHVGIPVTQFAEVGADWQGGAGPTDADVRKAIVGDLPMLDHGSVIVPPQVGSVFNNGQQLLQTLSCLSLEIELDGKEIDRIGRADLIPGNGPTYMSTNGAPEAGNKRSLGDGFVWASAGAGSELVIRGQVQRAVVVPFQTRTFPGGSTKKAPAAIYLPIALTLHGVGFSLPRSA